MSEDERYWKVLLLFHAYGLEGLMAFTERNGEQK